MTQDKPVRYIIKFNGSDIQKGFLIDAKDIFAKYFAKRNGLDELEDFEKPLAQLNSKGLYISGHLTKKELTKFCNSTLDEICGRYKINWEIQPVLKSTRIADYEDIVKKLETRIVETQQQKKDSESILIAKIADAQKEKLDVERKLGTERVNSKELSDKCVYLEELLKPDADHHNKELKDLAIYADELSKIDADSNNLDSLVKNINESGIGIKVNTVEDALVLVEKYLKSPEADNNIEDLYNEKEMERLKEYKKTCNEIKVLEREMDKFKKGKSRLPKATVESFIRDLDNSINESNKVKEKYESDLGMFKFNIKKVLSDITGNINKNAKGNIPIYIPITQDDESYVIAIYLPVKEGQESELGKAFDTRQVVNKKLSELICKHRIDPLSEGFDPVHKVRYDKITLPKKTYKAGDLMRIREALEISLNSVYEGTIYSKLGMGLDIRINPQYRAVERVEGKVHKPYGIRGKREGRLNFMTTKLRVFGDWVNAKITQEMLKPTYNIGTPVATLDLYKLTKDGVLETKGGKGKGKKRQWRIIFKD